MGTGHPQKVERDTRGADVGVIALVYAPEVNRKALITVLGRAAVALDEQEKAAT